MENQHRHITGYRELGEDEIRQINEIKELAEQNWAVIEFLERNAAGLDIDTRWLAIAKTQLQQGFMALVRAVAKPESF